jgi:hypothetical protein
MSDIRQKAIDAITPELQQFFDRPDITSSSARRMTERLAERITVKVLTAMREPTAGMIEAWDAWQADLRPTEWYTNENCARRDWQNMLDAALKPSPPVVKLDREPADDEQRCPDYARGGFED